MTADDVEIGDLLAHMEGKDGEWKLRGVINAAAKKVAG